MEDDEYPLDPLDGAAGALDEAYCVDLADSYGVDPKYCPGGGF